MVRFPINMYDNASAIYANSKWKYYAPYLKNVVVLFDSKKMPFFIKNGKRQTFSRRKNSNGTNRLYYGPGEYNYLMNAPANAKNVYAHFAKFKNMFQLKSRNPILNRPLAYRVRAARKRVQNKKNVAQSKRVNKLLNNVRSNRNISKAKTGDLLALVMRYQHPNAGAYYSMNNRGRIVNNNGRKPSRAQLLANIKNFKNYNMFN